MMLVGCVGVEINQFDLTRKRWSALTAVSFR